MGGRIFLFKVMVYIDDPVFAAAGPLPRATEELSLALLFAAVLGFPWHGRTATLIVQPCRGKR